MRKLIPVLLMSLLVIACNDVNEKPKKENDNTSVNETDEGLTQEEQALAESGKSAEDYLEDLQALSGGYTELAMDQIYRTTIEFKTNHPDHEDVPKAMFQSASIINNFAIADISQPDGVIKRGVSLQALDLLNAMIQSYPHAKDIKHAYTLKAEILHGNLGMRKEALETYKYLLKTYPDDSLNVVVCEDRIANIDKDPYEFLRNL